jgi:hypothetical protein
MSDSLNISVNGAALSTSNKDPTNPTIFHFFALPREVRDLVYVSLLCLSSPTEDITFSTDIEQIRYTVGISLPSARLICRQFEEELSLMHVAAHGPRFPQHIALDLAIEHPLSEVSVYQQLQWVEEVRFKGIPQRYLRYAESLSLECKLDPRLHEITTEDQQGNHDDEELLDEWMESLVAWLWDILADATALRDLTLRFTVGTVDELEALEKRLLSLQELPALQRVEMCWEWRHGINWLSQCDLSFDFLRQVTAVRMDDDWCVERRIE